MRRPNSTTWSSMQSPIARPPPADMCSARGGAYVTTLPSSGILLWHAVQSVAKLFGVRNGRRSSGPVARTDLAFLGQLADQGRLRPTLGRTYPLERARERRGEREPGHTRGKIVREIGS